MWELIHEKLISHLLDKNIEVVLSAFGDWLLCHWVLSEQLIVQLVQWSMFIGNFGALLFLFISIREIAIEKVFVLSISCRFLWTRIVLNTIIIVLVLTKFWMELVLLIFKLQNAVRIFITIVDLHILFGLRFVLHSIEEPLALIH